MLVNKRENAIRKVWTYDGNEISRSASSVVFKNILDGFRGKKLDERQTYWFAQINRSSNRCDLMFRSKFRWGTLSLVKHYFNIKSNWNTQSSQIARKVGEVTFFG